MTIVLIFSLEGQTLRSLDVKNLQR